MKTFLVAHGLEAALLTISALLCVWTTAETVRVGLYDSDAAQTEDLTFQRTLDELSLMLRASGRDQLARVEAGDFKVSNERIAVNTVAVVADRRNEPATAKGGFIADHVAMYNAFAFRGAVSDAFGVAQRNRNDQGPSLLRTVVTDTGDRQLSDTPNRFALAVRSPYAERGWREVRTVDWSRAGGVVGLTGEIALARDVVDQSRARLNGRNCLIRNQDPQSLLYCQSELAADAGRFYDFGFEQSSGSALGLATAFSYRPRDLWRNGLRENFGKHPVRAGDLFLVPNVGPFAVSVSDRGTLAANQWINGRQTFTNRRLGTISFFAPAGRAASGTLPLTLALDASFSIDLEAEVGRFTAPRLGLRRMSIIVVDARSGELRAIAETGRAGDDEPLIAFEPLLVGSVVKPVIASAILTRRPALRNLAIDYAGDTVGSIGSFRLQAPFANASNGCRGTIGFDDFIRCSSNQYAAELLFRSLVADGLRPRSDDIVPRDILEQSSLGTGLAEAFDVDAFGNRTAGRNASLWTTLAPARTGTGVATANRAVLPWESRPWIAFPGTDGTRVDWVARYAFGGWENRWTMLGIAEAYARIATAHQAQATILAQTPGTQAAAVAGGVGAAFEVVRPALRRVAIDGTAAGLADRVAGVLPGTVVLAKTGTLNEDTDRFKALAIAVGQPLNAQPASALRCGLIAVSYFEFLDERQSRQPQSSLPAMHLEFARGGFLDVLARHWERLSGCRLPAGGAQ
jgi:hypothetical protein